MSTCGKMIASGKGKILVDAREPSLVPDLIDSLRSEFPSAKVLVYDDVVEFSSAAMTGDMFSAEGQRILVLWDLNEENLKSIESVMDLDTKDALIAIQRKSIPKSRPYTQLRSQWELLTLEPLDEKACEGYVSAALKRRGCQHSSEVPAIIVGRRGKDLAALRYEVKKLSMLGRPIDKDTAARVVCGKPEVRMFDFSDAILRKRWAQSCSMASSATEGDLIGLLHVVQSQCMKLYKAASLKEQGMAPEDVATMLEVPPYIAKTKIIPLATQMGRNRILRMLDTVHAADILARTSRLPKRMLMETVVLKLLRS
jgi:DNA polymerase III delta subunit